MSCKEIFELIILLSIETKIRFYIIKLEVSNLNSMTTTILHGKTYKQSGYEVMLTQLPFKVLDNIFDIDENVQRRLDARKRNEISRFVIDSLDNYPFYFSPFVFSLRDGIEKEEKNEWYLNSETKLYILDGQHRFQGLSAALSRLNEEKRVLEEDFEKNEQQIEACKKKISWIKNYPISMQVYAGLNRQRERQLFADINTERSEVHGGLIVKYDKRDEYAVLVKAVVNEIEDLFEIEKTLSRLTKSNSAMTTMIAMKRCLMTMFEGIKGTSSISGKSSKDINDENIKQASILFFKIWIDIFPKKMNDRDKYVCGNATVQIALAYTVYFLHDRYGLGYIEAIQALKKLRTCSWKAEDHLFEPFYNRETQKLDMPSFGTAVLGLGRRFAEFVHV